MEEEKGGEEKVEEKREEEVEERERVGRRVEKDICRNDERKNPRHERLVG